MKENKKKDLKNHFMFLMELILTLFYGSTWSNNSNDKEKLFLITISCHCLQNN